jgi:hypothetical protein
VKDEEQNDMLGRLFRIAGARPAVPAEASFRVRKAVEARWKKTVRSRQRRRTFFISAGSIAASILFFTLCRYYLIGPIPQAVPIGFIQDLKGHVSVTSGDKNGAPVELTRGAMLFSNTRIASGSGRILIHLLNGVTLRTDVDSKLQLNSESALLLQEGAAYLDCGRAAKSIELKTLFGTVKDEGTQFEVRLQSDRIHVTVREGSVYLTQKGIQRTVQAGKQLIVDKKGAAIYGDVSTYGPHWDWLSEVRPTFRIEGRPLIEFLQWVSRENGWNLAFADPHIRQSSQSIVLHGSLMGLQTWEMPGAVLPVCGLTYSVENGVFTVKPGKSR